MLEFLRSGAIRLLRWLPCTKHVLDKLGADNRTEAVTRGRQLGPIR
jgi:hypothetical protein